MLVKATDKGYLGSLREIGEEFEVPSGASASWFEPVKADPEKPARRVLQVKDKSNEV